MFMAGSPSVMGADVLCAEQRVPILRFRPGLEAVESDVGKLTTQRRVVHRVTDTAKPLEHLRAVLAHPLPDDVQRDLEVGERATRDAREDGDYLVARELVAPEVEALARKVIRVLEDAGRDGPDVRDSDSRERPRPWEWRGVDALRELLLAEIEFLHEKAGGEDRGPHADLGDVLLDLVLAVEVRNARLSICGADRREDEMHACRLGRVGGGDALMRLGLRASPEWRGHREEGGGSFERLRHCGRVLERRAYERDPRLCELLRLLGVGGTRDRMNLVASLEKTFHYCATLIARGSRDDDDQLLTHGSCLLRARDTDTRSDAWRRSGVSRDNVVHERDNRRQHLSGTHPWYGAEMIVVGRSGQRRSIPRLVLGSIANRGAQ